MAALGNLAVRQRTKAAIGGVSWRCGFPLSRSGFSLRPPRPPNFDKRWQTSLQASTPGRRPVFAIVEEWINDSCSFEDEHEVITRLARTDKVRRQIQRAYPVPAMRS